MGLVQADYLQCSRGREDWVLRLSCTNNTMTVDTSVQHVITASASACRVVTWMAASSGVAAEVSWALCCSNDHGPDLGPRLGAGLCPAPAQRHQLSDLSIGVGP